MGRGSGLTTHDFTALDEACELICTAFEPPYLVGSAGIDAERPYRDVDVRLILNDEPFDDLFSGRHARERWELLSLAIGAYLRERTGLPIDFQVQRASEANALHPKPRNPLGLGDGHRFAGGGDATPWTPNREALQEHGDG
jgi:hypothetical protein